MKNKILFTLLFVLHLALINAQVNEDDSLALVSLYNNTDGANWTNNSNWLQPGKSLTDWHGIYLSGVRVYYIDLHNNNLNGIIPPSIGNLTELTDLYLDENNLSGPIPQEIENLTKLQNLSLNQNNLTELIPPGIGSLTDLLVLKLFDNQLMGSIPSQIGNLINLKTLRISSNQLSEEVPTEICSLTKLEFLSLDYNNFSGPLPAGLKNMPSLNVLGVCGNNFTFSDLEPLVGNSITTLVYQPQDQIPLDTPEFFKTAGDSLTLDITEHTIPDIDATNNQYQWCQDGLSLTSYSSSPELQLDSLSCSSAGFYHSTMTNSDFPLLTLNTDSVYIWVKSPPSDITLSSSSVDENLPSGTWIGMFTVTDADQPDGHTFSFAVGDGIDDADNDLFRLEGFELYLDTTPDYESQSEYKIRVKATDNDTYSVERAFTISVNDLTEDIGTGIEEMALNAITLFPNPANDFIILKMPEGTFEFEIELYDATGRLLLQDENFRSNRIRLATYPKGIYLLKMNYKDQIIFRKIIRTDNY